MGLYVDRLSAVMMTLITLVGAIIYRYSTGYMYQDPGYSRYLGLIAFTTFVLLCMVSSANLVMLFVFWQLLSWLLFLLAHNHTHAATLDGAVKTFAFLRIGDVAFLAGIVLAHSLYDPVEFQELFVRAAAMPVTLSPLPGVEISGLLAALGAGLVFGLINAIVRPVLVILTLPLTLVTLGLFLFVLNGFCFWLTSALVKGFEVHGFWPALFGALLVSVVSWLLTAFLSDRGKVVVLTRR